MSAVCGGGEDVGFVFAVPAAVLAAGSTRFGALGRLVGRLAALRTGVAALRNFCTIRLLYRNSVALSNGFTDQSNVFTP
jgi:hypothetical protein